MLNDIKVWIALVLAVLATYVANTVENKYIVNRTISATKVEMTTAYNKKIADQIAHTRDVEERMGQQALALERMKNEEIKTIDSKLAVAISELRNRPTRASAKADPSIATVGKACTGRELFREDGEFLTREAGRADKIVIERDYYYNQYEAVRKELDGFAK